MGAAVFILADIVGVVCQRRLRGNRSSAALRVALFPWTATAGAWPADATLPVAESFAGRGALACLAAGATIYLHCAAFTDAGRRQPVAIVLMAGGALRHNEPRCDLRGDHGQRAAPGGHSPPSPASSSALVNTGMALHLERWLLIYRQFAHDSLVGVMISRSFSVWNANVGRLSRRSRPGRTGAGAWIPALPAHLFIFYFAVLDGDSAGRAGCPRGCRHQRRESVDDRTVAFLIAIPGFDSFASVRSGSLPQGDPPHRTRGDRRRSACWFSAATGGYARTAGVAGASRSSAFAATDRS